MCLVHTVTYMQMNLMFFFFFSSRRRHTRLQGDWSSDVCSSDLMSMEKIQKDFDRIAVLSEHDSNLGGTYRSEERRVGKECRYRWWSKHWKRKRKWKEGRI